MREEKREREKKERINDTTAVTIVCCMCGCVLFCPNEGGDICKSQKKDERKK